MKKDKGFRDGQWKHLYLVIHIWNTELLGKIPLDIFKTSSARIFFLVLVIFDG